MPLIVQSTDITGVITAFTLANNDQLFVLEGVTLVTTGPTDAIYGGSLEDDIDLTIAGTVIGGASAADIRGDNINVTVSETGSVFGASNSAGFGALNFEGTNVAVTNHGLISGPDMLGVFFGDPDASLNNTGTINGNSGVVIYGDDSSIVNSGSIMGGVSREATVQPYHETGVYVRGTNATILNLEGGIISSTAQDGVGIAFENIVGTPIASIDNFGEISAFGYGIEVLETSSSAVYDITNYGVISGGVAAIQATSAVENIINGGVINGNVNLGGNDDSIRNTGQISGDIDLGTGDDFYYGNGGGTVSGTISGGAGEDTIIGGAQSDIIDGGTEADLIRGRAGDDVISGGSGDDTIRTGQGDDILDGGAGNEFMRGGAGDDTLIGGLGQDTMFGNAGSDTFVFNTASESTNAGSAWDRIMDFTIGQDLIDLSAFNARFIGTSAYAANGNIAEIRIFEDPNGDTRVFVDVNADGTSDMRFYLVNTLGITADDFIL
ncbi:MAG: calcium-binding protein [Sulfitobacter sp.]